MCDKPKYPFATQFFQTDGSKNCQKCTRHIIKISQLVTIRIGDTSKATYTRNKAKCILNRHISLSEKWSSNEMVLNEYLSYDFSVKYFDLLTQIIWLQIMFGQVRRLPCFWP